MRLAVALAGAALGAAHTSTQAPSAVPGSDNAEASSTSVALPTIATIPPVVAVVPGSNYSLPYTIYYNNGGNYYGPNMTYPPPSPRSFGFVADNAPHTIGTNTFDFSGHPAASPHTQPPPKPDFRGDL